MKKSSAKSHSAAPPSRRSPAAAEAPARRPSAPGARTSNRPPAPQPARRRFRGAAPWAARHAAKHAAEAAARNQEPPRPGSARATLRTPEEAERIKARIGALHEALGRVRGLKKHLPERFFEAGQVLKHIRDERLFDAKGYASFDAFVEREVDLGGKTLSLRLTRIPEVFSAEAAQEYGLEALLSALELLDQAAQHKRPPSRPAPAKTR
jgi:hypothetical protein